MIISMGTECVPHLPRLSTTKASVPESDRAQRFRKFDTGKHHAKFICLFQCTEEACSYTERSSLVGHFLCMVQSFLHPSMDTVSHQGVDARHKGASLLQT